MSRRSSLFLIVGSLSITSVGLLLVSRGPGGPLPAAAPQAADPRPPLRPPAPDRPALDARVKGPTVAILDSGLPRNFDRTYCRVVGVHDFTGEGAWDEHGHCAIAADVMRLVLNRETVGTIKAALDEPRPAGKSAFEEGFRKVVGGGDPAAVEGVNVIFLKVIDRLGETTPGRILRAVEAVAREDVDVVGMALNVWLPEHEATDYFESLARAARSSGAVWTAAWPNDADSHDLSREVPFPANSPYVLATGIRRPDAGPHKPPRPGLPPKATPRMPSDRLASVLPTARQVFLEYHVGRAKDHMARKEYDKAIRWYSAYLPVNPTDSAAWTNLGDAYKGTGDLEAAKAAWQIATEADPKAKAAYYNLAFTLYEGGQEPQAFAAVRAALRVDPEFAHAHSLLGTLLIVVGRLKDGIESYKRAIELSPNSPVFRRNLVRAYFTAVATDDSFGKSLVEAASKACALDDAHLLPNFILGMRCQNRKMHERCIEHLTKAIKHFDVRDPFDRHLEYDQYLPMIHRLLSQSLAAVGRNEEAKEHSDKADLLDPPGSANPTSRDK